MSALRLVPKHFVGCPGTQGGDCPALFASRRNTNSWIVGLKHLLCIPLRGCGARTNTTCSVVSLAGEISSDSHQVAFFFSFKKKGDLLKLIEKVNRKKVKKINNANHSDMNWPLWLLSNVTQTPSNSSFKALGPPTLQSSKAW